MVIVKYKKNNLLQTKITNINIDKQSITVACCITKYA